MPTLILVDIQNDFLPGGRLAVAEGEAVVPVANALMQRADHVVATLDWHPADHQSFASQHKGKSPGDPIELNGLAQILWPDHCVQWTGGAALAPGLHSARIDRLFTKGEDPTVDSYSGFWDNGRRRQTGLQAWLLAQGVQQLWICGLALDYCVKATALDAVAAGFACTVVLDGTRAVGRSPGDGARAVEDLQRGGVRVAHSADL